VKYYSSIIEDDAEAANQTILDYFQVLEQVLYDCLGFAKKYWLILQCLSTDPH
jgi:hypothetical protein